MKLTTLCSHAPVAALLPTRVGQTHVTNATDTNNVDLTFQSCKDIILSRNLRSAGLLD